MLRRSRVSPLRLGAIQMADPVMGEGGLATMKEWHLGTWFSGGLGSVRLMVGLDDLKGPFQPKRFSESMIPLS